MDIVLKTRAIHRLRPQSGWILDENTGLSFMDASIVPPTETEITAMMEQIQKEDAQAEADKAAKRKAALAKLAALGLTTDDLSALGL